MSRVCRLVFCHLYNLAILSSTVSETLAGDLLPPHVIGDFSLQPEDLSFFKSAQRVSIVTGPQRDEGRQLRDFISDFSASSAH